MDFFSKNVKVEVDFSSLFEWKKLDSVLKSMLPGYGSHDVACFNLLVILGQLGTGGQLEDGGLTSKWAAHK